MTVYLTCNCNLQAHFCSELKRLPAGTALETDFEHQLSHLVYVYGEGVFDSVPLDWLSLEPIPSTQTESVQ